MAEVKRVPGTGPRDAKIVIVGDVPGETEERHGIPFCGTAGEELKKLMSEAGLDKSKCYQTNVFKVRPPNGKIESWYRGKKELPPEYPSGVRPIVAGKYLCPEMLGAVEELRLELASLKPNLILVAGSVACWALGLEAITRSRGVVSASPWGKVLPIYHPSAVLSNWAFRPIVLADLLKAEREHHYPELRRPERTLWIEPTMEEVKEFCTSYLEPAPRVSFDIETKGGTITCISLAPSETLSLCIPLWDRRRPNGSYWSVEDEVTIWKILHRYLVMLPMTGKKGLLAQNGLYDIQYLAEYGLFVPRLADDTMLAHHALFPEMKKGLGFLASVYTNELSWKQMVKDLGKDK